MSCSEIHVNDENTVFTITILDENSEVVDISLYTPKQIVFTKPSGTKITKTATFTTDGTDGKIQYTTASGDIDEAGLWSIQGIVGTFHTNIDTFLVYRNL